MNCLEWLPIYFGILKTGAIAVPLNFRYASDEIEYCLNLAEVDVLVFGPEFIGRIEEIAENISKNRLLFFVGDSCPSFAEDYASLTANCSSQTPMISLTDSDNAAIYFLLVQQDFPKQFYIITKALSMPAKWSKIITGRQNRTFFYVFHRCITRGQKCTGLGASLKAGKQCCSKAQSRILLWMRFQRRSVPLYGF